MTRAHRASVEDVALSGSAQTTAGTNSLAAGGALYAATSAGLRRSTDEGSTWTDTGFAGRALAVAVSPSDPDQVAVVDPDTRFYRSSDAATSSPGP